MNSSFTLDETIEKTGLSKSRIRYIEARYPQTIKREMYSPDGRFYSSSQIEEFKKIDNILSQSNQLDLPLELAAKRKKTIVFASGKGGVGKTSLCVNLSILAAAKGLNTVLFDGDLGMADAHALLGVKPQKNISSLFLDGASIDEISLRTYHNLKFISGGNGQTELANLDDLSLIRLNEQLNYLKENGDYLLIDSPAGIGKGVMSFISIADQLNVVITPSPSSLLDAYGLIKSSVLCNYTHNINVIVNMVYSQNHGLETFENIYKCTKKFLNIELNYLGSIRKDQSIDKALIAGLPIVLKDRFSNASRNIIKVSNKIFK